MSEFLVVLLLATLVVAVVAVPVALRVDRWRAHPEVARSRLHPAHGLEPHAFARPRHLLHLTARTESLRDRLRRPLVILLCTLLWDWRRPDDVGGDGWPLGRFGSRWGQSLRSQGECGMLAIGATRSGKTSRVLATIAVELDDSPCVIVSNKADLLASTLDERRARGPVWVIAPMTPAGALPVKTASWTPLSEADTFDGAQRLARWMLDADPDASRQGSDGARFYNREAVAALLPACLHAAALGSRSMSTVLEWLRGGLAGLDEPREILSRAGAGQAADALAGVQALDERPRSLLLMSSAQLLDVYRFDAVQQMDHEGFRPECLLSGGTLYLLAPQAQQDAVAPLFGALLGAVMRVWEQQALATGRSDRRLTVIVDEAASVAAVSSLPEWLAVSTGWGVRWALAYQTISQIRARYGQEAEAIISNLLVKVVLGPVHDQATAEYFSNLAGEATRTARSWSDDGRSGTSHHERQTQKVPREMLAHLPEGHALVVHGRDLPFRAFFPRVPLPTARDVQRPSR